jgi:hypothetical protein
VPPLVPEGEYFMNVSQLVSPCSKKIAFAVLAALILPIAAAGQSIFHDPQSRYDVQVPAGWQLTPDNGVDQVVIRNGAVQAILAVVQQNKGNAMTAQQFVDTTAKEFRGQCPTFQSRQNGAVTLAGWPGVYSLFVCNDPKSPTVAETSSALTANGVLIGFTMIAPLAQYYASVPVLDGIRNSLHVTGEQRPPAAASGADSQAMAELKKACIVGVFAQVECARQIGLLLGKEELPAAAAAPALATGSIYRDGQGRFSLRVPKGWNAFAQGENGVLGVQLRSGSNWINVMPAEGAASTDEVVIHQEQKVAARSNSSRKIPFGTGGIIQLFGNGVELSYDHFSAATPQGEAIETYIGGVGGITGANRNFLLLIAAFGAGEKDQAGGIFLSVGQSFSVPAR